MTKAKKSKTKRAPALHTKTATFWLIGTGKLVLAGRWRFHRFAGQK